MNPCTVYSLSLHADYHCRHSGACCTSGWPIPVERTTAERLTRLVGEGRLEVPDAGEQAASACASPGVLLTTVSGAPDETPALAAVRSDGACVFYERDSGLCAIHRQCGPHLLPIACRQFPRVSLLDSRGLFVTLSHYCPTAAALLFDHAGRLEVVESPAAFPPGFPYDPLDARDALPPLLRPGVLLDADIFGRWEREVVGIFAPEDRSPEDALDRVTAFTEALRSWQPRAGDLAGHFDRCSRRAGSHAKAWNLQRTSRRFRPSGRDGRPSGRDGRPSGRDGAPTVEGDYELALAAIPDSLRPVVSLDGLGDAYRAWVEPERHLFAVPLCRYLAAKAFASWLAYQGHGLRTIVSLLHVALSLVKANAALECARLTAPLDRDRLVAAIRRTDELLVHLASCEDLARLLRTVEKVDAPLSSDVR